MPIINQYIHKIISDFGDQPLAEIFEVKHYPKEFVFGPHSHSRIEINFVQKGSCAMRFENDIVTYQKHDCMIIYPNVEHYFFVDKGPASLVQVEFKMDIFPELKVNPKLEDHLVFLHRILTNSQKHIKIINHKKLTQLLECIVIELNEKRHNYKMMTRLHYGELFILISRHIKETLKRAESQNNPYVNLALKQINSNFTDLIDIEKLASDIGISARYLRKLFKNHLQISPIDYIMQLRINKAKEMMHNTSLNLKEIAFATGFSNQQYFSKQFKQLTGMTPISYRQTLFRIV